MSSEVKNNEIAKEAIRMAWPAVCESFFVALAGMVDSLMVSSLGSASVAAVGLTTQPKFLGLSLFSVGDGVLCFKSVYSFGSVGKLK